MNLDIYNTHMELYPYKKDDYPVIEKMYTAVDKFTGLDKPCGYMIEDGKLLLPRGTSISRLESICDVKANYIKESDSLENMDKKFYPVYEPRNDVQKESIEFLIGKQHQLALNLKTGVGKTYCVAYAITELNEKALIITPNESIKQQWLNTFVKMFDYRSKDLMNIAGSNIIAGLIDGSIEERNVYFVNHQTLHSYMTSTNGYMLHEFFKKIKVGIKVYDESHMNFGNILLMDYYSNTNRTWYITATFDRSEKTESECFKRAFSSVEAYGDIESAKLVDKHVVYHVVKINSRISPKDRSRVIGYAGMTAASYGRYAFLSDPNNTAYHAILEILNKVQNVEGKVLIFVPLIEAVDEVVKKLKKDIPDKSVAAYHSKCTADEKESAEKKDIIVSTIKSCGTGRDIPGLRVLICCEPVASKVVAEQMIGRLRPYGENMDTYFWDVIDICLAPINWWWKARYKKIQDLVKKTVYIDIDS